MPSARFEVVLMLSSLLLAAAPLWDAKAGRAAGRRVPPWVPFALLAVLGIGSVIFELFNPELAVIAAI
jgi:hypothetical protein